MTQLSPFGVYAIYLRKSRADQEAEERGQFETLAHHQQILTDLASRYGITISRVYREIVSGETIADRPEMMSLLDAVKAGEYNGVLVTELSRLARGRTADQATVSEAFRSSRTLIITPGKVYDPSDDSDDTYIDFELFMARQEYKYITRRMQAGRKRSRLNGYFIFSRPPFGWYLRERVLCRNADSLFAKDLLEGYADGRYRLSDVYDRITERAGERWTSTGTTKWLKNPAHCGLQYVPDGDEVREVVAVWADDAIISKETHQRILDRIGSAPRVHRSAELQNPLAGLIKCSKCGRQLKAYKSPHGLRLAHCNVKSQPLDRVCSGCSAMYCKNLIPMLADALEATLPEMQARLEQGDRVDLSALYAERKRVEQRLSLIYSLLEDGTYTAEEFRTRRAGYQSRLEEIDKDILAGSVDKPDLGAVITTTEDVIDLLREETATPAQINSVLREIVSRIDYSRERGKDPEIVIIPK